MSGQVYFSINGIPDYELYCDQCGARFQCEDDSFYSWPVLCDAAEAEGWRVHSGVDGSHECGDCAAAPRARRDRLVAA
ncbi:hypothetical protein K3N28_21440 [Glycomyces sp. TRM65418]|uniref:hypothetical protein n=1 Tax=Glycomyces sp. TRM65418 TaxID=2867006 RepID=UPI001CE6B85F|nr:hypothetical protein [Glycomyces sp. TRM65418]MCC3765627.1 hypothetical protein [Glycomyces sp. TRM65418]QZD55226.1 hypothetical protein K3N28_21330 [Glycomyces sp. TRM65418]